jgi:hypothetical protein
VQVLLVVRHAAFDGGTHRGHVDPSRFQAAAFLALMRATSSSQPPVFT